MEYQLSSFEQWSVVLASDCFVRPPVTLWCKQLMEAKMQVLNHFMHLNTGNTKPKQLETYVVRHYQSLETLIETVGRTKDIYSQILLKSLEQIRFFFELHFKELIPDNDVFHMSTCLSMEEFAYLLNVMLEQKFIQTRSKKELARHICRYIKFNDHKQEEVSTEMFYKTMQARQRLKVGTIEKLLTDMRIQDSNGC